MPYLRALSAFRDGVRKLAMEGASANEILALSDKFRDEDAVELGIALDDQAGESEGRAPGDGRGSTVWKRVGFS
jgi:hypothetical protein